MIENSEQSCKQQILDILGNRWSSRIFCLGWLLTIVWLSLTPSPPKISNPVLGWDKMQHASAYGLLTLLALRAFAGTKPAILAVFLGVVTFGGIMEIAQGLLTSNRFADLQDSFANLVGAFIVSLVYFIIGKHSLGRPSGKTLLLLFMLAAPLLIPLELRGEDNIFNSVAEVRSAASRIADEGLEVARYPLGIENNGLFAAIVLAGSVAVTTQYDEDIRDKVASRKGRNLDRVTDAAALLGDPFVHLGVAAAVYGGGILSDSPKYRELGEMFGEAAILADAATLILKQSIGRGRPSVTADSGNYKPFQTRTDFDSLPSMHTASSFAMASVMASASESPLTAVSAYAAAAFVGFSRIYQDKHWASDVLLGAAIGELCGRVVTHYHAAAQSRKIVVAPMVSDSSAVLALVGRF
jgi:membrane-associated phospholipid phosphatase/VanZ family protein